MFNTRTISHGLTNKGIGDCYLEPVPVSYLQSRVWCSHGPNDRGQRRGQGQLHLLIGALSLSDARGHGRGVRGHGGGRSTRVIIHSHCPTGLGVSHPRPGVYRVDRLCAGNCEVALRVRVPALCHHQFDGPRLLDDLSQDSHSTVITHVLEVNVIDLEDHVTGFDSTIQGDCSSV